ncbi:hypothetical protein [Bacillus alkalicellulosilyticus]|uniref:hypothetical protein n=1 Tax=Alkalihalobacterium alkalicellulosilyticum TaxID=1912214 RepID=UPI00099712EB|nr:hypothetical protein [Bacillus alkalicellulosilyticus]
MLFDIKAFESNLKQKDRKSQNPENISTGISNVIRHVWDQETVTFIDFDSFSYQDCVFALEAMESIALTPIDEGEEVFLCDPDNPFTVYNSLGEVIYTLRNTDKRHYQKKEEPSMFL